MAAFIDASTVVSLLPVRIDENKPGLIPGQFIIKAVEDPMAGMELLHVVRANFPVYLDENRPALIVPAPSDLVAESICRDYKISMNQFAPGVSEPGLFWVRDQHDASTIREKFKGELLKARTMQTEWFKRIVGEADDDWAKYKMRRVISTMQRLACNALKLTRDWNMDREINDNLAQVLCKFCRADIHPEAITCRHCGGIQDMAKFTAMNAVQVPVLK